MELGIIPQAGKKVQLRHAILVSSQNPGNTIHCAGNCYVAETAPGFAECARLTPSLLVRPPIRGMIADGAGNAIVIRGAYQRYAGAENLCRKVRSQLMKLQTTAITAQHALAKLNQSCRVGNSPELVLAE